MLRQQIEAARNTSRYKCLYAQNNVVLHRKLGICVNVTTRVFVKELTNTGS